MIKSGFILVILSFLAIPCLSADPDASRSIAAVAQAQVDWLLSKGGFVHPKLEIRPYNMSDPMSPVGVFTSADLPMNETLIVLPKNAILTPTPGKKARICDTTRYLMKQRELKAKSEFAPYIDYIFGDTYNSAQLPVGWSVEGKQLLATIRGPSMPPYHVFDISFRRDCKGTGDPYEEEVYQLVTRRSWDDKMLPVIDMINHRNGPWFTVDSNSAHDGDDIRAYARRDIKAGEQLYLSYNECADCDFALTYVCQDIIREFGFVEQYPRRFRFPTDKGVLVFDIDEEPEGEYKVTWRTGKPNDVQMNVMRNELQRLVDLSEYVTVQAEFVSSTHERDVSIEFYQALRTALEQAIRLVECVPSASGDPGSCTNFDTSPEYDALEAPSEEVAYNHEPCDFDSVLNRDLYEDEYHLDSQYNEIVFKYNQVADDTCLRLNDHLQACSSFRPHYHEVFVHYPARYVDEVKRVAFLGGGDNMIVHEILKYPSLELALGMELDHQVVRSSFTQLGTEPHFDDERLEWWFGDASKSLFMLPEEYQGSFDLVLLDLQTEVVENIKVAGELSIMQAAMLLLKPEGVMARNEDWEYATKNPFMDYMVDLYYLDVPILCCQGVTLGSHTVDFLRATPKDHGIDTLFLKPAGRAKNRYDLWYNYRRSNDPAEKLAKAQEVIEEVAQDAIVEVASSGLLMVLEAENTTISLEAPTSVQKAISLALKNAGLTEASVKTSDIYQDNGYEIVVVMNEGYVVARTWPQHNYCAFDILLWTGFEKHNTAKAGLVAAVGSKTVSSYRLVTGGMVSGASERGKGKLPRVQEPVEQQEEEVLVKQDTIDSILRESMSVFEDDQAVVVVLCGEQSQTCHSISVLETNFNMKVLPIWSCGNISADDPEIESCLQATQQSLAGHVKGNGAISGIVIDPEAPRIMGQVLLKTVDSDLVRNLLLQEELVVVSITKDAPEHSWRRALLDRFRTDVVVYAPAHRAEVLFNSPGLELGVFYSNEVLFYSNLMAAIEGIEESTGLVAKVRSVKNGLTKSVDDFTPSKVFSHDDYNHKSALEQWLSQQPLGEQKIFQFTSRTPFTAASVSEALKSALNGMNLDKLHVEPWVTVGDGCVVVAFWSEGSIIVTWDGKNGVTANLFADGSQADRFSLDFRLKLKAKMTSNDEFPRGIGRVVNFDRDDIDLPRWA